MAGKEENEVPVSGVELELESIKKELAAKSKEELIEELAVYRLVIPKMGPFVKWFIENYFKPVYLRFRMGRETVGFLIGCVLIPDTIQVLAQEEIKKYTGDKTMVKYELRIVNAPVKELSYYDVVLESTDWEETEMTY